MSLDFWKAFDQVVVSFLEKVLKVMGFPKKFINWVAMCHRGALVVNIAFSLRQGDPLALILYIEPLLQLIKTSLRGIRMGPARIVHHP